MNMTINTSRLMRELETLAAFSDALPWAHYPTPTAPSLTLTSLCFQ